MAIFFGATLFFGITTALCVPFLYAYCKQSSVIVQEDDEPENEEEFEKSEDVLLHSTLLIKESLEEGKRKIMKDATVNTIETMASDATSYKKLASIKENCQEEQNDTIYTASNQTSGTSVCSTDSSSSFSRIHGPLKVQALVHAKNPSCESFTQETFDERNAFIQANNNNSVRKRQFFKNGKTSERFKKIWTNFKSRGFSKLTNTEEDSNKVNFALRSIPGKSSSSQGIRTSTGISSGGNSSSTLKIPNHPPVGHSTLRDSKQKLALRFQEVNGPPSIHIESPRGSSTSFTISVRDLLSPGVPQSQNKAYFIEFTHTPFSSCQDTDMSEKFSLNRYYQSLPGRLRQTGNKAKKNIRRSSSVF